MWRLALLSGAALALVLVPAQAQSVVPGGGSPLPPGQILPPTPAIPPPQGEADAPSQDERNGDLRRRPWRELTESLLDWMAPRPLRAGEMLDDPLTTGFGNADFVEPGGVLNRDTPVAAPTPSPPESR